MAQRLRLLLLLVALAFGATAGTAQAQPAAYGGGCLGGYSGDFCISVTPGATSMPLQLNGDFYINSWGSFQNGGHANLWFCIVGPGCYYQYTVTTNFLGHYPIAQMNTGMGPGEAKTMVEIFNLSSTWVGSGYSQDLWWVP